MTEVAICAVCGERTPLTADGLFDGFYVCANPSLQCLNVVAVRTGHQIVHTNSVLEVDRLPSMLSRSHALPLLPYGVAEVKADDEYVLVRLLCRSAKSEESFHCHAEKGDSLVLVCTDGKRYIGYLDSSVDDDGTPLLHQIFIADDHRKRGLGTEVLRYWAETYVFPRVEKFGIESPNARSLGILQKLGYIQRDGNKTIEVRCFICSLM
jgi:hypothetical protein